MPFADFKPLLRRFETASERRACYFGSPKEYMSTFNAIERKHMQPAKDQEFGYESFHLICFVPPHLKPDGWDARTDLPSTFEIQVRTIFMHAYAEPQHNLGYKAVVGLPSDIRRELAWIAASAWGADQSYERIQKWGQTSGQSIASNPDDSRD